MRVVTSAQSRAADLAMFERGTPVETLMERAGSCLFEFLQREFSPLAEQRIVIFCGTGNNGGDGHVLAQLLERRVAELLECVGLQPEHMRPSPMTWKRPS